MPAWVFWCLGVLISLCSDGAISITLISTELENAPLFDALSYALGNPHTPYSGESKTTISWDTADIAILCNGKRLFIAANLRDGLHMLQTINWRSENVTRQRYIWIDAICIDQRNLPEREAQVSLMDDLYRKASTVIGWLGDDDFATSDAFDLIERFSLVTQNCPRSIRREYFLVEEVYSQKLGITPVYSTQWLAIVLLLHRPFFSRAWIVQEVFNAKAFVLVCGKMLLPWVKFWAAIQLVNNISWYHHLYPSRTRLTVIDSAPGPYKELLSANIDPGSGALYLIQGKAIAKTVARNFSFQKLLRQHRDCKASDPRDKIYAFLGIADRDAKPFTTHPGLLIPDYRIPAREVYIRTTRCLLQSYSDLSLLYEKEPQVDTRIDGLPSWAPDWSAELLLDPLTRRASSSSWGAAGALMWQPDTRDFGDTLLGVQGKSLGNIVALSEDPTTEDSDDHTFKFWASLCTVGLGIDDD